MTSCLPPKFGQNCLNGFNLVKRSHFLENSENWGQNDVIDPNLGKAVKNFPLKVSNNYFSQVYGLNFFLKMSLMGSLWSK